MWTIILSVFIFFNIFYIISLIKKDFSIVDIAWGLSFLLIFLSAGQSLTGEWSDRQKLIGLLVFIWSMRLSGYIFLRSLKLKKEDYRYAQFRKDWGKNANITAYFRVFILQGFLALIIGSPLILIHSYDSNTAFGTGWDFLGLSLWIIGFLFEAIGDYQKNIFKKNPKNKGKILTTGLWKYTRHPNYFGDALLWWGLFFLVINDVPFWFAFWGPAIMNFFLLKVSGVALLEKKYEDNDEFSSYKKKTNAFIPWFERKELR